MKRFSIILVLMLLTACSNFNKTTLSDNVISEDNQLKVFTTVNAVHDFTTKIGADKILLTNLMPKGVDVHDWEPTIRDMIALEEADVVFYNGAGLEHWIDKVKNTLESKNIMFVNLSENIDIIVNEGIDHIHNNIFNDEDVKDRELLDWSGDWQSVFPYLIDGTLDPVMEHKAKNSEDMTADDYFEYYKKRYETDFERIVIDDNTIEFFTNGVGVKSEYEYAGFEILTYELGSKGVRYLFSSVGEANGAPQFVQFSDHMAEPAQAEHFHIYFGYDGHDVLLKEMDNSPSYFPSLLDKEGILEEMLRHNNHNHDGHDHNGVDPHVWLNPQYAKVQMEIIAQTLADLDELNKEFYFNNLIAASEKIDELDNKYFNELNNIKNNKIVVYHSAYSYLADRYGIQQIALDAIMEHSEPTPAVMVSIINTVKENAIKHIFYSNSSDKKIMEVIANEIGEVDLLPLNTFEGNMEEELGGINEYFSVMESNLKNLVIALK